MGSLKSNSFGQALSLAGAIALVFGVAVLLPIALFSGISTCQLLTAVTLGSGAALVLAGMYLIPNDISG